MSCGKMIGDKWIAYSEELKASRPEGADEHHVMDGRSIPKTRENALLQKYKLTRSCCRKHFLTHVDLMSKI